MASGFHLPFVPRWMKPNSLKRPFFGALVRLGVPIPLAYRVRHHLFARPDYAFGMYAAATQAKALGLDAISSLEFGVAGGNGLVAMERIADEIEKELDVRIAVYGFDRKEGLPNPVDYRDLPHIWRSGFYRMDETKLRAALTSAELVLGDVAETVPAFLGRDDVPPIGFVAFDLDLYSATKEAFRVFDEPSYDRYLPRVYAYFDDMLTYLHEAHCEYIGELCAVREFNEEHADRKICPLHGLAQTLWHPAKWSALMYACHFFSHPAYTTYLKPHSDEQLPLTA